MNFLPILVPGKLAVCLAVDPNGLIPERESSQARLMVPLAGFQRTSRANHAGKIPFFLQTAGVLLRARGRRHAPASFEAIAGRNETGYLPLTKVKTSIEDPISFSKTKRRLEVSCAIYCLSLCLHFPSSAALDRHQPPLPGVVRIYPRLGRTSIACKDVRGAIRAIASSRTYDQCMATASGTYAYCGMNPIYAFERQGGQLR